jgi:ABC-type nitrate/sulfonate/bicarbonate transport system substrate-binding protein
VVLPPPLLVDALRSGQVDGFCVGEPWNSLAVDAGIGVIATVGSDVWPNPPEKVLGMRARFADENPAVVAALVRALHGASLWAAHPDNHADLAQLLSQPRYVGAPARLLLASLSGQITMERDSPVVQRPAFLLLGESATAPRPEDAIMLFDKMVRTGQVTDSAQKRRRAAASFRTDLHATALGRRGV